MVIIIPTPQGMDTKYFFLVHRWEDDWTRLRFVPACLGTWISIFLSQGPWRTFPEIRGLSARIGVHMLVLWPGL